MDAVATIIQGVGTVVALVGVIVTFLLTRRGQRQDLKRTTAEAERAEQANRAAEAAGERSEAAASLTIDALTRIADAVETMAEREPASNVLYAAAAPARVRWSLTHFQGDMYMLENTGDATAYNVDVSAHESMIGPQNIKGGPDLGPDESLTFIALRTMGTSDSTITVRWADEKGADPTETWRYPLPPRPPR